MCACACRLRRTKTDWLFCSFFAKHILNHLIIIKFWCMRWRMRTNNVILDVDKHTAPIAKLVMQNSGQRRFLAISSDYCQRCSCMCALKYFVCSMVSPFLELIIIKYVSENCKVYYMHLCGWLAAHSAFEAVCCYSERMNI